MLHVTATAKRFDSATKLMREFCTFWDNYVHNKFVLVAAFWSSVFILTF